MREVSSPIITMKKALFRLILKARPVFGDTVDGSEIQLVTWDVQSLENNGKKLPTSTGASRAVLKVEANKPRKKMASGKSCKIGTSHMWGRRPRPKHNLQNLRCMKNSAKWVRVYCIYYMDPQKTSWICVQVDFFTDYTMVNYQQTTNFGRICLVHLFQASWPVANPRILRKFDP